MGNEQNVNQVERNIKVKRQAIIKGCLIGAGLIALGYVSGHRDTKRRISCGLEKCCLADPTLEDHLKESLKTLKKRQESMNTVD